MQPAQLSAGSFSGFPPQAKQLAVANLRLLRSLPVPLDAVLMRELAGFDWRFPAEQSDLLRQFAYLSQPSSMDRAQVLLELGAISLSPALATADWVNQPAAFLEQFSAWMWSSGQMDRFRAATERYSSAVTASAPARAPAQPRLCMVALGRGAAASAYPLFRKLRASGVLLTRVIPDDGWPALLTAAEHRATLGSKASAGPQSFDHWYIDGGLATDTASLAQVSYRALDSQRALLLRRIQEAIATRNMGPEELRSLLARMRPDDIGLSGRGGDATLAHFQLSLLTEGSGTQIFATTFVQWAARECIRRAQPETLLVRYAPRQQAQTMNAMLTGAAPTGEDLNGSLIDADMGAYYTWLAMRRLSGSDQLRFLAWHEGNRQAVVIGPGLPHGTTSESVMSMTEVLALLK